MVRDQEIWLALHSQFSLRTTGYVRMGEKHTLRRNIYDTLQKCKVSLRKYCIRCEILWTEQIETRTM